MLFLDTETYSEVPIKSGTHRYTDSCTLMIVSYAIGMEGVEKFWDVARNEPMPADLKAALEDQAMPVVMHKSDFDRNVLRKAGVADIPPTRIIDTMVQAYCHGLPGGLDKLCMIFGIAEDKAKMKEGRALIHLFCKPVRGKRVQWHDQFEKWQLFCEYAVRDITSMREIYKRLPKWNYPGSKFPEEPSSEHKLWVIDQRINDRGFAVDMELAKAAVTTAEEEKKYLDAKTFEATEGQVEAATQRDALLKYVLEAWGVTLPDMKADTLQRRIEDENLPVELRQLLDLRVQSGRNSSAKYKAVMAGASSDGRLRGCLQFCGAPTTGRWSGKLFQPQNCMRPTMEQDEIETAIADIKSGGAALVYDNMAETLGNCVRGVIVAGPGKKLIAADLKSIEGRGLAYLANDEPIVEFYRTFDAGKVKYDSYMLAYSLCFGVEPHLVEKWMRQIGKPIELGFGYGGGVAAFLTFALVYHLDLDKLADTIWEIGDQWHLGECSEKWDWAKANGYHAGMGKRKYAAFEYVKQKWRAARPRTVMFWERLADGFKQATLHEGQTFNAGPIKFRRDQQWLRMRLPSGRNLVFLQPRIDAKGLSYMGLDRYTRRWSRVYTHGGKLSGIATQAFAGDVLRDPLPELEDKGFPVVLTVHDEAVSETDYDRTLAEFCTIFTRPKSWAPGLPLAADGFEAYRYRKDG